jgi:hypothetical protein
MRRTERMRDVEAFQPEHPPAAAGQVPARSRTHAADADDDRVVGAGHPAGLWTGGLVRLTTMAPPEMVRRCSFT